MARVLDLIKGVLSSGARYYIYPGHFDSRSRQTILHPSRYGLRSYEELFLHASDGTKLHAYLLLQPTKQEILDFRGTFGDDGSDDHERYKCAHECPTVLIFHGNSGNIGNWLAHARRFYRAMKCNVLLVEYRGYGKSEGRPSQDGIRLDAEAALDFIDEHISLAGTPVILYGQSLGAAIAIDLATRRPDRIKSLILENPFLSLPKLISHRFPALAPLVPVLVPWACRGEIWDSEGLVQKLEQKEGSRQGECSENENESGSGRRAGCKDSRYSSVSMVSCESTARLNHHRFSSNSCYSTATTATASTSYSSTASTCVSSSSTASSSPSACSCGYPSAHSNRPRILFLSGSRDTIVPPRHTAELARTFVRVFERGCRCSRVKDADNVLAQNHCDSSRSPTQKKRRKLVKSPPYSHSHSRLSLSSNLYSFKFVSEKSGASAKDKRKSGKGLDNKEDSQGNGHDRIQAQIQVACFKYGGHNDMASQPGYWETIMDFIDSLTGGGTTDSQLHPCPENEMIKLKEKSAKEVEVEESEKYERIEEEVEEEEVDADAVLLPTMGKGTGAVEGLEETTGLVPPPPLYTP